MNLSRALRLEKASPTTISFIGSGGKTSALFQLAREFAKQNAVIVTSTSHLGVWQIPLADRHLIANSETFDLPQKGIFLVTGMIEAERTKPVSDKVLTWLHAEAQRLRVPLLIEADGSRQKPLKAPASHEPPLPEFTDLVVHVTGLSALGKPLTDEHVHRAEIFSQLSGLPLGDPITPQDIIEALTHPQGGLKNIPAQARRVVLLNQADTPELESIGGSMARELLSHFNSALVGSLQNSSLQTFERTAGIILAAGEATRYGSPKQLLNWKGKPFVRQVAETALQAGLEPVVVVTGFRAAEIESTLSGLPVTIVHNPGYQQGQGTSIRAGVQALLSPPSLRDTSPKSFRFGGGRVGVGSAIFLLADQPQIPVDVIRALVESHGQEMQSILAPLVLEERRANPVLFDRDTFPDLLRLKGDVGGRAIFDRHRVEYLPWHDDILLLDVDKPEDYERLKGFE
jgi:molybdenum cofactor cytidylyltransferase